jgi:preprotein translocase subunit SecA
MAGRGVDIKLGGVPADPMDTKKVIDVGGLFVLGTERHESRRIDNQLRGRAARQGDPGETQFFVSTDDDLMRIFAGDRLKNVMTRLKLPDDMPIEQSMITKMLETAQKKVESHNFDIRKHLLDYDDVLNKQRGIIYKKRRQILDLVRKELEKNEQGIGVQQDHVIEEIQQPAVEQVDGGLILEHDGASQETVLYHSLRDMILEMVEQEIEFVVTFHTNADDKQDWNLKEIYETMSTMLPLNETDREEIMNKSSRGNGNLGDVEIRDGLIEFLVSKAKHEYDELVNRLSQQVADPKDARKMIVHIEKSVLLRAIDNMWVDYLVAMDYLRAGIGLRGYGQRDPLVEYKKESFQMFNQLQSDIQKEVAYMFFKVNVGLQIAPSIMANDKLTLKGAEKTTDGEAGIVRGKQRDDEGHKVGRNDPCPCGSGKKYKKCHGA